MTGMIVTRSLTKRFGRTLAVDAVDLDVREGDRYGFLGPNGSGKTTTVRMLLGLVYPTSGEIELMGHAVPSHVRQALPDIGALVEGPAAVPHLSGRTNLSMIDAAGPGSGRRTRRARIEESLELVGLAGIDRRPVRSYSLGMRQRLGLAAALLRKPRLLVLDEPTNGLDPRGIREIRDLLTALNRAGTTVFLSSHLLSEVDELCDRVGIVDRGRLVLQEDLATLRAPTGRVVVDTPDPAAAVTLLDGQVEHRAGTRLLIRAPDAAELNSRLVFGGIAVREIGVERRTLEQIVLDVTGDGTDRVTQPGRPSAVDRFGSNQAGTGPAAIEPANRDTADNSATNGAVPDENTADKNTTGDGTADRNTTSNDRPGRHKADENSGDAA